MFRYTGDYLTPILKTSGEIAVPARRVLDRLIGSEGRHTWDSFAVEGHTITVEAFGGRNSAEALGRPVGAAESVADGRVPIEHSARSSSTGKVVVMESDFADTGIIRIVYRRMKPVSVLAKNRDFCVLQSHSTSSDGTSVFFEFSVQHRLVPPSRDVRGNCLLLAAIVRPVRARPSTCKVTLLTQIDLKVRAEWMLSDCTSLTRTQGSLPPWLASSVESAHSVQLFEAIRAAVIESANDVAPLLPGIPLADSTEVRLEDSPQPRRPPRAQHRPAAGTATLEESRVGMNDFEVLALLGKGGYGKVLLVRRKLTSQVYAMKTLRKKEMIARRQVHRTLVERDILSSIKHPFIVELKFAFQVRIMLSSQA